jgi:hypothetical protein
MRPNVRIGFCAQFRVKSPSACDVRFRATNSGHSQKMAYADKPPAAAQNEPSFTLVLVQSGSVPKAIEFFLDSPADAPPA